jgi:hypothetical protein
MATYTGIIMSNAVQVQDQTFAGPWHPIAKETGARSHHD